MVSQRSPVREPAAARRSLSEEDYFAFLRKIPYEVRNASNVRGNLTRFKNDLSFLWPELSS